MTTTKTPAPMVLTDPAARAEYAHDRIKAYEEQHGHDTSTPEFLELLASLQRVAGVRPLTYGDMVRHVFEETIQLFHGRRRCENDEVPLDVDQHDHDYPTVKASWLNTQDDLIRDAINEVIA